MAYTAMKKLIDNENTLLELGRVTEEAYAAFKESNMNKLDIFLAKNRITADQYDELVGLFK
jgi:hypothetical protein